MTGGHVEKAMEHIGEYFASLQGIERDRETGNPGVWLLTVAAITEIIRHSALEAFDDWTLEQSAFDLTGFVVNGLLDEVRKLLDAGSGGDGS